MCLGIPMKIIEIFNDGLDGIVEAGGVKRHCFFHMIDEPKLDDYVVVHAGCAIEIIDEAEARENLKLIETYVFGDENES